MNVYLEELGGDLAGKPVSVYNSKIKTWLTFFNQIYVSKSSSEAFQIVIWSPADAETGIYTFRVVVCDAEICEDQNSPNLYGSEQFTLEIV